MMLKPARLWRASHYRKTAGHAEGEENYYFLCTAGDSLCFLYIVGCRVNSQNGMINQGLPYFISLLLFVTSAVSCASAARKLLIFA